MSLFFSRYGGDEFIIVHETEKEGNPRNLCENIRKQLHEISLSYTLSISIGATEYTGDPLDLLEILATADINMYMDKLSKKKS